MKIDMTPAESMNTWQDIRAYAKKESARIALDAKTAQAEVWRRSYELWARKKEMVQAAIDKEEAEFKKRIEALSAPGAQLPPMVNKSNRPIIGVMPSDPAERARIMDAAYEKMQAKLEAKQQAEWDKRENAVNHSPEVTDEDLNKWD